MKYIDLDLSIQKCNSALLKKLPRWMVSILKKIVKQDEINRVLNKFEDSEGIEFLSKLLEELGVKIEIEGAENLPEDGRCFFAANHPYGFLDGLILTHTVGTKYGKLKAIGNDSFLLAPHLKPIIAAVNVFGSNSKEYLMALEELFASDYPITHFPAGVVSRIRNGKVADKDWQKSFIKQSIKFDRPIVPFHFLGRNSYLFYFIYLFRTAFGIKQNIELMLLPSEIFNKKNTTIRVRIGKPILPATFDKSKTMVQWAQYVRQQVYSL